MFNDDIMSCSFVFFLSQDLIWISTSTTRFSENDKLFKNGTSWTFNVLPFGSNLVSMYSSYASMISFFFFWEVNVLLSFPFVPLWDSNLEPSMTPRPFTTWARLQRHASMISLWSPLLSCCQLYNTFLPFFPFCWF